jgi:hypothetical protein
MEKFLRKIPKNLGLSTGGEKKFQPNTELSWLENKLIDIGLRCGFQWNWKSGFGRFIPYC